MKRYNLIQARGGDFTCGTEGVAIEGEGKDVIDFKIKGGKLTLLVPPELPDNRACEDFWFNQHACLEIELEDGTRLSGWVRSGEAHLETT